MKKLKTAAVIFGVFFLATAQEFIPINAMHESGSIANTTFFNAGAALPSNAGSLSLNPAIPAAFHYFSRNKMSIFGNYANNGGYADFYKTGGGGSLSLGMGKYAALEYNLKKETENFDDKFNRATIAYGSLFDESDDDALFIGFNISYYNFTGKEIKNNLVAADLGFYQSGDGEGLSWGIVFENIFGYSWNEYYEEKSHNILNKKYNSFLFATNLSFPLADEKILLLVPIDVRFWGFMNKELRKSTELKHRTEVHGGFELQLAARVCGRFGWAWIPEKYTTDQNGQLNYNNWKNRFSGGFGLNFGVLSLDAYFASKTWGAGFSLQL